MRPKPKVENRLNKAEKQKLLELMRIRSSAIEKELGKKEADLDTLLELDFFLGDSKKSSVQKKLNKMVMKGAAQLNEPLNIQVPVTYNCSKCGKSYEILEERKRFSEGSKARDKLFILCKGCVRSGVYMQKNR